MKNRTLTLLLLLFLSTFIGCQNHSINRLKRQMKPLAKEYLTNDNITQYEALTIDCVDTLSELSYAKLCTELLSNMSAAYQNQLEEAYIQEDEQAQYLQLYVNETNRTLEDFEELMSEGDLQRDDILLYMVTGSYQDESGQEREFLFLVNPDKKTLHELDPFGDNLLYKDYE